MTQLLLLTAAVLALIYFFMGAVFFFTHNAVLSLLIGSGLSLLALVLPLPEKRKPCRAHYFLAGENPCPKCHFAW